MNTAKRPSTNWLIENYDLLFLAALILTIGAGVIFQNELASAFGFVLAALGYLLVILPRGRNFKDDERVTSIKFLTSQITIGITMLAIIAFQMLITFKALQISAEDVLFYLLGILEIVYIGVYAFYRRRM